MALRDKASAVVSPILKDTSPFVSVIMLVHKLHREYNNNSPGDQFDYLVKET